MFLACEHVQQASLSMQVASVDESTCCSFGDGHHSCDLLWSPPLFTMLSNECRLEANASISCDLCRLRLVVACRLMFASYALCVQRFPPSGATWSLEVISQTCSTARAMMLSACVLSQSCTLGLSIKRLPCKESDVVVRSWSRVFLTCVRIISRELVAPCAWHCNTTSMAYISNRASHCLAVCGLSGFAAVPAY
jgi:hypothetical protein